MRRRKPKNFDLEERLARYADAIEVRPAAWAGRWAEACHPLVAAGDAVGLPRYREVRLDLGCGKGDWLVACAARDPEVLWVGMDFEPVCVAYAAEAVCEAGLPNAVVVPGTGADVVRLFGPGELAQVAINFPTPFTRRRDAHLRLVALERLMEYRRVLAPGGRLRLRTDSQPLRDFALGQLEIAGYDVLWSWDDERAHLPDEPVTYYEERLVAQGARVLSVCAVPGPEPEHVEQTRSLSLVDYLPEDLDAMGYVPYGMEWTVETIRRRRH